MFDISSTPKAATLRGAAVFWAIWTASMFKKYSMPFLTNLGLSGMSVAFSTNEQGNGETESSKQQAMNDARESFLEESKKMFNQALADRSDIRTITFIPAGTRIIVYPKVDLWLRTMENEADTNDNTEYKDVLIDDKKTAGKRAADEANRKANFGKGGGSSSSSGAVVYEEEANDAQPTMALVDDMSMASSKNKRRATGATPPPPPSSGVVTVNRPSSSAGSSSSSGSSDVPQLFRGRRI